MVYVAEVIDIDMDPARVGSQVGRPGSGTPSNRSRGGGTGGRWMGLAWIVLD